MKNDLSIEALLNHLRGRRATLQFELDSMKDRAEQLSGAIDELLLMEQQAINGTIAKSRLTCE